MGDLFDRTGLVTAAEVLPDERTIALTEADDRRIQETQILVRALPHSDNGFLVDWVFGVCDPEQDVVISRVGTAWSVAVDLGRPTLGPCDAVLLNTELQITTSTQVDARQVIAMISTRPPDATPLTSP